MNIIFKDFSEEMHRKNTGGNEKLILMTINLFKRLNGFKQKF